MRFKGENIEPAVTDTKFPVIYHDKVRQTREKKESMRASYVLQKSRNFT